MADLRYVTVTETEWKAMADEIERLRAVIRETHAECAEWSRIPGKHAPGCKLYEIEP